MKKNILTVISSVFAIMATGVYAKTPSQSSAVSDATQKIEMPVVVVDAEADRSRMPKAFRTTKDTFQSKKTKKWVRENKKLPSRKGMDLVSASASGQFSDVSFRNLIKVLEENKKIYIVDLRQEPHGFANGHAISLYGRHNAVNKGISFKEAEKTEKSFLQKIASESPTHIYKVIEKRKGEIFKTVPLRVHPAPVLTEQELVESHGATYRRFRTLDHAYPDVETMDDFIAFVKKLPEDAHLHFHCRGGRGRASQYMVYYDTLKNAKNVDLEDILDRQHLIGSKPLHYISKASYKDWKKSLAENRLKHITLVYEYARDPKGYSTRSWKEWLEIKGYNKNPIFQSAPNVALVEKEHQSTDS